MGLQEWTTCSDKFEPEEGDMTRLSFPCCACKHKSKTDKDEPCLSCGHNLNAVIDAANSTICVKPATAGGSGGRMTLSEIMQYLVGRGCYPCCSYRGGGIYRAHINGAGNQWDEGRTPDSAMRKAFASWKRNGMPMDGYACFGLDEVVAKTAPVEARGE